MNTINISQKFRWKIFTLFFLPMILLVFSCNKQETPKEDQTIFNASDSAVLQNSVISLPTSLNANATSADIGNSGTFGGSIKYLTRDGSSSSGITGIYQGITQYVAMADMFKGFAVEIMKQMIESPLLKEELVGTEITLGPNPNDPNAPKRVKVEHTSTESYEWKVSLYDTDQGDSPNMIIRFSFAGLGAKGRILWSMSGEDEDLADAGFPGINITRKIDIAFDGTQTIKTLEVKLVQDLTNLVTYAKGNWNGLSEGTKDMLDLGQPSKVFLNASYDDANKEYTIYGTSYHPTWKDLSDLGEQSMFGDPNRIMYTFKAKSKETDTLKGSKVYLALPLDTVSDISTLWTEHSIGAIYTPIFKEQIRASVNEMIGSASQTEEQKYYMMYWVLGSSDLGITPITVTSMVQRTIPAPNTFTQEEYDAVYNWYSVYQNPNVDLTKSPMDSLTNFNLFYQSFADAATKQWLVDIVTLAKYAKTAIDARGTSDFVVSSPEFDTFLATNTDPNAKAIRDMTKEISYITNPAFFKEGGILLGTFNLATNGFNKITDGIWSEIGSGTDTALDTLNAFNLDEINPYVPSQVVTMDVTIE